MPSNRAALLKGFFTSGLNDVGRRGTVTDSLRGHAFARSKLDRSVWDQAAINVKSRYANIGLNYNWSNFAVQRAVIKQFDNLIVQPAPELAAPPTRLATPDILDIQKTAKVTPATVTNILEQVRQPQAKTLASTKKRIIKASTPTAGKISVLGTEDIQPSSALASVLGI